MSAGVAGLRLDLGRLLQTEGRWEAAVAEVEAALAETGIGELAWRARQLYGELLYDQSRLLDAISHWIGALELDPEAAGASAIAIARVLDGPRSHALARQITPAQRATITALSGQPGAGPPLRLLAARLRRLVGEPADPGRPSELVELPRPDEALDEPVAALLAQEYAETGRVDDGLALLGGPLLDRFAVAVRARLLVLAGRPAEAAATVPELTPPTTAGLVPADDQSLTATAALAAVAADQTVPAAELVAPYHDRLEVEPRLAAVVVALARRDHATAESLLVRLESLSGRSDDIRLLRLQLQLERGEVDELVRVAQPLRRLVDEGEPTWLRLQRSVRSADERFRFVLAMWSAAAQSSDEDPWPDLGGLTWGQRACVELLLADRPGVDADGVAHLSAAAEAWQAAGAFEQAVAAARRAYALDPGRADELADTLVVWGRAMLGREDPAHAEVVALAEEAWRLDPKESAAALLVEAVINPGLSRPAEEAVVELGRLLSVLSGQRATPGMASYLGWIQLRLSEVAPADRLSPSRYAAELLLAVALVAPTDVFSWNALSSSLSILGAFGLGLLAAEKAHALVGDDASTLGAVIAHRLNRLGAGASVAGLLDDLERVAPGEHAWVQAVRLKAAMLDQRPVEVDRLLDGFDDPAPWIVETVADAKLLSGAPDAEAALVRGAEIAGAAGALGSQARMELLQGHLDQARRLAGDAARAELERPRTGELVDLQARLVGGDTTAEPDWLAEVASCTQPGDLWTEVLIDLPLLRLLVPAGSPSAGALDRLEGAARARIAEIAGRPVDVAEDLREARSPALLALATLWQAEDGDLPWPDLAAAAAAVRVLDEHLQPVAADAADAVLRRSAEARLAAITLRVDAESGVVGQLAGIDDWCEALLDPDQRFVARALHALHLLLTSPCSLADASEAAGLGGEPSIDRLADAWIERIPDVENGWRFYGHLESELSEGVWLLLGPAVLDHLTALAGLADDLTDSRPSSQSVGLGQKFIPPDTSIAAWPLFTRDIPAIREEVAARTGVEIVGFHVRTDASTQDCLSYAVYDRTLAVQTAALGSDFGEDPDGVDPDGVDPDGVDPDRVVARFLRTAVEEHLGELYWPYHVNQAVLGRPELVDRLDDPVVVVAWLDAARAAIARRRRVEPDVLARTLIEAPLQEPGPAALARAVDVLPPWREPASTVLEADPDEELR